LYNFVERPQPLLPVDGAGIDTFAVTISNVEGAWAGAPEQEGSDGGETVYEVSVRGA
jgi:hypothetical protein